MDIRLKERLIGATVLVLAAVIFIPMVLDGPGSGRQVSRSVPLPENSASDRRTVRIDLESGNPETPMPAAARQDPPTDAAEPATIDLVPEQERQAQVAEPGESDTTSAAREQPVQEGPREPASMVQGDWTVQAGSFSQEDNAEKLARRLRELDYPAYVSRYDDGERVHYRVRVGGFPSRDSADAKAREIRDRTGEPARPARTD